MNTDNEIYRAFFPVSLRPLYWEDQEPEINDMPDYPHERYIGDGMYHLCPRHFAVVRLDEKWVYQCVTDDCYELITNRQLVDAADSIAEAVFGKLNLLMLNRSYPEFWHKHQARCAMTFWDSENYVQVEKDTWSPFIRIFNGYDKNSSVKYFFGFIFKDSKQCIGFEDICINIKQIHTPGTLKMLPGIIEEQVKEKKIDQFDKLKEDFRRKMQILLKTAIKREDILPLCLKFFEVEMKNENEKEAAYSIVIGVNEGMSKYFAEPDSYNAYSLMKMLTFIVCDTNMRIGRAVMDQVDFTLKYQNRIGAIINDLVTFVKESEDEPFRKFIGEKYYQMAQKLAES